MYHAGGRVPPLPMEGLAPASADDLPPLGELLVDDPFWRYPAREGAGHLRVWVTAGASEGYLAVVTETGGLISVTESAGRIWADLARRYRPSLVLLEHHPAPEFGEGMETLDLVSISADGSPHWTRVWPTPGGESPSRRTGALDGRARAPDRQRAAERVRLVRGRERLTALTGRRRGSSLMEGLTYSRSWTRPDRQVVLPEMLPLRAGVRLSVAR